ncbi:ATP-dependent DNA helicase Q4 [Mactra antiquata]
MLRLIAIVVVCSAQVAFGALQLRPYNETAFGMFLANDFNSDGVITRLELESSFDKYDADGNGVETRREYTEFICATSPSLYQLSHYLFDEYDMNGDHHLRKEDYDALFDTMDIDKDGNVTADEFIHYWELVFPKYENVGQHGHTFTHGNSACH